MDVRLKSKSCISCVFLYETDEGYSNWTVEMTALHCAMNANPNLPAEIPHGWVDDEYADNWSGINCTRCEHYRRLDIKDRRVKYDVDRENTAGDFIANPILAMVIDNHLNKNP